MNDKERIIDLEKKLSDAEKKLSASGEGLKKKEALLTDLSEQIKRYEQTEKLLRDKIERIEQHFNSIIDSTLDAIITADENGNIVMWSKGAQLLFGWTENEALGKPLTLLMPQRYHQHHHEGFTRYVKTRVSRVLGRTVELHGIKRDGQEFPIDLSLGSWEINGQLYFCGIIRDVSIRKKIDEEKHRALMLEQKNKELEQFTYVASHDLQEPLRTISSFVELFISQYGGRVDELGKKYLHYILQSSNRLKILIKELLEYSHIGRAERVSYVDLNFVVNEVLHDLEAVIKESHAQVEVKKLPVIKANETELRQLFQNLISNSIKFRKKDIFSRIIISAEKKKDIWQFCVEDNGIGIPKKYQHKVFILFQRLHSRSEYEGTGLGLALCKKIVEFHGGEIWIESEPGLGTKICFTIKE